MNPLLLPRRPTVMGRPEAEPLAEVERRTLSRLNADLALVRRVAAAERERVAALAETWGHRTFARFLREQREPDAAVRER